MIQNFVLYNIDIRKYFELLYLSSWEKKIELVKLAGLTRWVFACRQATISLHEMTLLDRFVVYTGTGEVGLSLVATLGGCKIDDVPIKHFFLVWSYLYLQNCRKEIHILVKNLWWSQEKYYEVPEEQRQEKLFDQKGEIRYSFSIPWTCCWLASSLCFRICNHSNQHRYAECGDTICIATQLWTLPWVEGHGALGWRPWTPVAEVVGSL